MPGRGGPLGPQPRSLVSSEPGQCALAERLAGTVILPGFNTEAVHAKWRTEEIYIEIYDADTFGNIYNNVYEFYITPEFLKLVSEDVMISTSRKGAF